MNDAQKAAFGAKVDAVIAERSVGELAIGWLMYEHLRTLKPREFQELHQRNISGSNFDDMIREAIANKK